MREHVEDKVIKFVIATTHVGILALSWRKNTLFLDNIRPEKPNLAFFVADSPGETHIGPLRHCFSQRNPPWPSSVVILVHKPNVTRFVYDYEAVPNSYQATAKKSFEFVTPSRLWSFESERCTHRADSALILM